MKITVRPYTANDKQLLISFIESLHTYLVAMDSMHRLRIEPGYGEQKVNNLLAAFEKYEGVCFFAEAEGKAIGFVAGLIAKQSEENLLEVVPTRLGVVKELFVIEEFRNQQVGERLLEKIERYFKEKGCDSVWLEVFGDNHKAQNFYKSHGYQNRMLQMLKKV